MERECEKLNERQLSKEKERESKGSEQKKLFSSLIKINTDIAQLTFAHYAQNDRKKDETMNFSLLFVQQ